MTKSRLKADAHVRAFLAAIGRKGGQAKTPAKAKAARENIRKRWAKDKKKGVK